MKKSKGQHERKKLYHLILGLIKVLGTGYRRSGPIRKNRGLLCSLVSRYIWKYDEIYKA